MGWDGSAGWKTPSDARNEAAKGYKQGGYNVVAQSGKWMVVEKDGKRFAVVALVERRNGMLMMKVMDEETNPFTYNCPEKLFEMLSEPQSKGSAAWREGVKAYREAQVRVWGQGEKCMVFGTAYEVVERRGPGYLVKRMKDGRVFNARTVTMKDTEEGTV